MEPLLLIPIGISFLSVIFLLPLWIKKAKDVGLVWEDMNKYKKPLVPGGGGVVFVTGFVLGVLIYISLSTFYFKRSENVIELFAILTSFLILAFIGLIDGLMGWKRGGLRKKFRMMLTLFAAIPLMVINAGASTITIPFVGTISFGVIFPLILIPLGIIATSTTFNFLAGFNGLESGQGILIFCALGLTTYFNGDKWLSLICLLLVAALFAFWLFNKYPARVFPGDVLTYPLGGMIAVIAIMGNIEVIALIFFIPYIIEVILKSRGKLQKQSFGMPNKRNELDLRYPKIYGLEHFAIFILKKLKGKVGEKDVVYFIYIVQLFFILLGFLIFNNLIFN